MLSPTRTLLPAAFLSLLLAVSLALAREDGHLAGSLGPEYEWIRVTGDAGFPPRDGAGALTFAGRMWLLGGWNPRDKISFPRLCNNEVWSSVDGRAWSLVKPNTFLAGDFDSTRDWEGRHTAGYVVFRRRMWIVGGDPLQGHYQPDVWNSTDGRTWQWVNRGQPVPWGPRVLHHTFVFKQRIWVLGGQTLPPFAPHAEIFYRDIWTSGDGLHWERLQPVEPYWSARGMIGGSAIFKGRIWVLGGGTYETPTMPARTSYNDVWSSSDGLHWTRHLESAPWAPRTYHDVAVFDGRLWVLAGFLEQGKGRKGDRNDVWYSSDGLSWRELPGTPWKPRHAASVFVHGGALWVVAGHNMEADVWRLVPRRARSGPSAGSRP
jgi:hypothetical protein